MSKTLSIPIRQTITLPDNWQACRTPQELSYWLIAQFEEFESDVSDLETAVGSLEHDVGVLQSTVGDNSSGLVKAVNDLTTDIGNVDARLVTVEGQINTPSTGLNARVGALETTVGDSNSGLVKDVAQLLNDFSGLAYDVASLNTTVNTAGTGLVDRVGNLETIVSAPLTGLTAKVSDLEAEAEYSYDIELFADENLPTPASNFKKARFYITSDDLGAWTATITSALATVLKSVIGYQAEFIVASRGSEAVKLDVTAIYDVMKLDSIDGIDHTIFGTGASKLLTVDDPTAKKLTIWWNGYAFDWSVANVAIKDLLLTESGKRYRTVGCVLRCINGNWQQIGGDHATINISSITQGPYSINVNYSFTAKNVVSFVACPDEDFARHGYNMGASVGLSSASINVYKHDNLGGYVYGKADGTFGVIGNISAASMDSNGKITITHQETLGVGRSLTMRDNDQYKPVMGTAGSPSDDFKLYDAQGNVVNTVTTDIKVYWTATGSTVVTPETVNASGNIWCFGIMEID